ncbi:MAG: MFS transporter [Nocardioidaceae bacterium]
MRDRVATAGGAVLFALSLGLATVALPLLAIRAGYSAAEIGVLTAVSALSQMSTRLVLGPVMRVVPEWVLVVSAGMLLAASNGLAAASTALGALVAAQLTQGVARACFWTGSQTHVVRGDRSAVSGLAMVNLLASAGLVIGPVLAGVLTERSPQLALGVGAGIAALGCVPAMLLERLPPFSPPTERPPGRLWRRPGVDAGCLAGVTAGAWRGLLGSYVPVALNAAQLSSSTIGVLVSVANAAALAGAGIVSLIRRMRRLVWSYAAGAAATGIATALVALLAGSPWAAGAALAVSGLGAGALQTVGPAMAAESVHPEERGDVIAVSGTFRAGALFLAPLAIAGMLAAVPLTLAMGVAGTAIALPAVAVRRLLQRNPGTVSSRQQTGV